MKRLLEQDRQAEAEARRQGAGGAWRDMATCRHGVYALHAHCSVARLSEAELAVAVRRRGAMLCFVQCFTEAPPCPHNDHATRLREGATRFPL